MQQNEIKISKVIKAQQVRLEKQGTNLETKEKCLSNIVVINEKEEWEEAPMWLLG